MHIFNFPDTTRDLLNYLRSLPNDDPEYLLTAYSQSLNLISDDLHSLFIFLDYINLSTNFYETDEIEHLYNLFKVKLRKFKIFWINYIKFEVEVKRKDFDTVFSKVLEYLKVKIFDGKEELTECMINEKASLQIQLGIQVDFDNEAIMDGRTPVVVDAPMLDTSSRNAATLMDGRNTVIPGINTLIADANTTIPMDGRNTQMGNDIDRNVTEVHNELSTIEILSSNIFIDQTENISNIQNSNTIKKPESTPTPASMTITEDREVTKGSLDDYLDSIKMSLSQTVNNRAMLEIDNRFKEDHPMQDVHSRTDMKENIDNGFKDGQSMHDRTGMKEIYQAGNDSNIEKEMHAFELELTGPQKLRFSPNKREPYSSNSPRKASKQNESLLNKKFIELLPQVHPKSSEPERKNEDAVFSCDLLEKTINFNQGYNLISFKDKDLVCINKIGKGGYSNVYSVFYGGNVYALKQIRVEDNENLSICLDEIDLLKRLSNREYVIRIIDFEIKNDTVKILLEYGETDLQKIIQSGPMNLFYIKYIWESILNVLIFIHANRIVHRDIKPANFVLVKGKVKIIDFGISKSIKGDTTSILNFEKAGTLNYISPEQCGGRTVGRSSDVWSAGCILYHMIYGKTIHNGKNVMDVIIMMSEKAEIKYDAADEEAIECMKACLVYDPRKRAKPEELLNFQFLRKT